MSVPSNPTRELVIEPTRSVSFNVAELWHYRELFYFFTWRDVKVKYKQTLLGILWVVLQPLLMMAIFSFFLGKALNVPSGDLDYPVFALSGIIFWNLFSGSITAAGTSMLTNAPIIKKIYFPRLIIPFSSILVALFDFCVAFLLFLGFLIVASVQVNLAAVLIWWPVAILLAVLGSVGLGCWLSALTVKYRDVRFVVPFIIQLGFFVTPVVYPFSVIKAEWVRYILAINPMYGAITAFRIPLDATASDLTPLLISMIGAVTLTVIGLFYFKKTETFFADLA